MKLEVEIRYEVDESLWNKTLKINQYSLGSQTAECYIPHKFTYNSKPVFIKVFNCSREIVGQLSAVIHFTNYGIKTNRIADLIDSKINSGSTLRWSHGPIIHDHENFEEIFSKILLAVDKIAKENNVNIVSCTTPPKVSNFPISVFKKNGYSVKPWITYITNLQRSTDEIFKSLHNKTRYDIRKAEKEDLQFEISSSRESMDIYFELKFNKEKINQIKKNNKKFSDNIWENLFQKGLKKNFIVRFQNKPQAIITNFLFNGNISQVGVATSSDNKYAGTFLIWNTIKWASENNYRTYDVGGANPNPISNKEKGIELFKSKWASEKHDYYICTKVFNKTKYRISKLIKNPKGIKSKMNIKKQNRN
jgi:serine/alanine adding enzyme